MSAEALAQSFVQQYYQTFDQNRAALAGLYQPHSKLHFEGQCFQGTQDIVGKLTSLKLDQCRHDVSTMDVQDNRPLNAGLGVIVFVTGKIFMSENPINFAQVFVLLEAGPGQWYVLNDLFRLSYS
eukprot:c52808_g1_i1.p1 GENE.c52808_g1_i1~~c52808_g1_i1.p1  ORF type:complete len:141 (+),score=42.05 c52808_g1_i1:49-423(+)